MLDADRLLPYTLAVVALILAPGPNQAMVVARSLNGGRRAGIMTQEGAHLDPPARAGVAKRV